ncbi:hypothetical protein ACXYUJ_20960 [Escherichia coli]
MMTLLKDTPGWCFRERLLDEAKRMTQDALKDTPGWCFRERLLDEAKRMTQDALKDTSRMENENRSG